jgi:hypothetical protein
MVLALANGRMGRTSYLTEPSMIGSALRHPGLGVAAAARPSPSLARPLSVRDRIAPAVGLGVCGAAQGVRARYRV